MTPSQDHIIVPLYRLAHGRTGDKGNRSNISVIAWQPAPGDVICEQVTEDAVRQLFADRQPQAVKRYLPQLQAMNLVLDEVLDGGVNGALNLTATAKRCAFAYGDAHPRASPADLLLAGPPLGN